MSKVTLSARNRQKTGSAEARRSRRGGRIPAVLYGRTGAAISLDIDALEFGRSVKSISESTIVKVDIEGSPRDAFVKATQRNIIDGNILHVDFYEVESGALLKAKVSLHFSGTPVGVREGGNLETPLREIEVECLPGDLPERIDIDLSGLKANQTLHARDIALGEKVRLVSAPDQSVAMVKFARAEAAAEAAPAAAAAPAAGDKKAPAAAEKKAPEKK